MFEKLLSMQTDIKMIVRGTARAVRHELWSCDRRGIITAISPRRYLASDCGETTTYSSNLRFSSCLIRKFSTQSCKMVKARKYVLVKYFTEKPQPTDLKLVEEELPPLKNGGREN